ncbi:MAG: hypothetical protein KKC99_01630, partial [Proteobacteria bacterium]|nr:hypothetical protein [Pseudomonadota bacterium]
GLTEAYRDTIYDKSHQLEEYGLDNPNQEKLARLMTPVDGPLGALIRYVSDRDFYPDETWVELLFARFPWINTLFITDPEGWMLDRYPNDPIKRISEPLQFEAVWRETFIQTRVDYPELGPELYLGTPMFKDADFKGLIVVSFDPRTLFSFCPNPEELIIIHPGGGVWSMDKNVDAEALKQVPWAELLQDEVQGEVEAGGIEYTWLARYVGTEPYLYAVRSIVEP